MLGIRFIKAPPSTYLMVYRDGKVVREGIGLAFHYWAPRTSLVAVPVGSVEAPFIFEEVTGDFQKVTVQGAVTYRIADPRRTATLLDFTLRPGGEGYVSEDPTKLPERVVNAAKVLVRKELLNRPLREALAASGPIARSVAAELGAAREIEGLGIEVLGFAILAIKPTPETARALEAEAREAILRDADEAVYSRRNAAVEHERAIKENELATEIAVEVQTRKVRETKIDAEEAIQARRRAMSDADMVARVELERKNRELTELAAVNARTEAEAKAFGVMELVKAYRELDPRIVQALAMANMAPGQLVAQAFQSLAENADKIGELNLSPDLLRELLASGGGGGRHAALDRK